MRSCPQVLVFPDYRENPFVNLLQLAAAADGFRFTAVGAFESLIARAQLLRRGDVLHVHWTTPLLQQVDDERVARRRLSVLQMTLRLLRARGIAIIWTVHNRLPHELPFPDVERRLYTLLADSASRVHVMAPRTQEALADVVELDPAKVVRIAHPSFEGVYDASVTRDEARGSFDLSGERAVLFLGQIRPYKGIDSLVAAAGDASARVGGGELALLLAGSVREMSTDDFVGTIPDHLRTVTQLDFVPDGELARWFCAADVAVFPYRAILNSGSVHLAATFRVPMILPADEHLVEQFGAHPWVRFFDPASPVSSIADLLADPDLFSDVTDASFDEFLDPIAPWQISREYAALLRGLHA